MLIVCDFKNKKTVRHCMIRDDGVDLLPWPGSVSPET